MAYRRDVRRYVSLYGELKRESPDAWYRARHANSVESAYRILKRAFPDKVIARPYVCKSSQHKFLSATGQYTQNGSDPEHFDDRETIATGAVDQFSPGARKPRTRRRPQPEHTIGLPTMSWLGIGQFPSGATIGREDSDPETK
jgi:hypothetical protein